MDVFFIFLIGTVIGSFLNVVIDRVSRGESIVLKRSYCESCKKQLKTFDLIPVFSFIILSGKCRYCHAKLSFYYPFIELLTGFMFSGLYFYFREVMDFNILVFLYALFIFSCFIALFFTDIKYGLLPDKIIIVATVISILFFTLIPGDISLLNRFLSGFFAFLFFFALFYFTKGKGMGFGDVKLSFLLGFFLGFPHIVLALYFAFLTGAMLSIILIMSSKKSMKDTIAFGPFLIIGTIVMQFYGSWFLTLIGL